jgi:hypothetical protein
MSRSPPRSSTRIFPFATYDDHQGIIRRRFLQRQGFSDRRGHPKVDFVGRSGSLVCLFVRGPNGFIRFHCQKAEQLVRGQMFFGYTLGQHMGRLD